MSLTYIALGANLGDPIGTLLDAVEALRELSSTQNVELSAFYRTAPFEASGPDYINAVACFHTQLDAHSLLQRLQAIETQYGRVRSEKNAPRTLDLDILLYGNEQHNDELLTLPHPRMHQRAFVLYPLADLNPKLQLAQGSIQTLLESVSDQKIEELGDDGDE